MTARRDLVPFAVTLITAAGFVLAVARWSPSAVRPDASADASALPSPAIEVIAAQRDASPVRHTPDTQTPPPPLPASQRGAGAGGAPGTAATSVADGGGPIPVGLDAARAQLDALRARVAAIDVDAGGPPALLARRVLASAAAPAILEILGEGGEGFEGRYDTYRASVRDGGAAAAAQAQHLRPEDLARAALLDELYALQRPAP